jgi:hypothetical protein
MAPRTARTARQRSTRSTPNNPPPQAGWVSADDQGFRDPVVTTSTAIDVDTVARDAKDAIEARQNTIQRLRLLGDELRAALQHVESLHEALTAPYNPPMGNPVGVVGVSGGSTRMNR